MPAPLVRPHITYEELCEIPDVGNRYELFDGEAYMTASPLVPHQLILGQLYVAFLGAARDRAQVLFAPMDVVLAPDTAVQPDLIVIRNERREIVRDVVRGAPDLVVEILSPSTSYRDRGLKMESYARHGIGEYWIVDGAAREVEIYRLEPGKGAYRLVATCRVGDRATTPLLPALAIPVESLFEKA
ncbi:MAG TPA: Uma2 family endonuclease [Thermoanaerobaculia bacterium]